MSTATIPFQFRNGFFPGLGNTTGGGNFNYVDLTEIDGDKGLREALRIWWAVERIKLTPSGTLTLGSDVESFSYEYQAPDALHTGASDFVSVSQLGSICASSNSIGTETTKEPAFRAFGDYSSIGLGLNASNFRQEFNTGTPVYNRGEIGRFIFNIYFTGTSWRLYYYLQFVLSSSQPTYFWQLQIANPNNITGSSSFPSGTVDFFGYTLNWESKVVSSSPAPTNSGVGLSCYIDEWTF